MNRHGRSGLRAEEDPSSSVSRTRPSWSWEATLAPEEVTFSLLAPEEVTVSSLNLLLAESTPEAAAVGPRGDQAVVGGSGSPEGPLCPVGFNLNLSISSDKLFEQPLRLVSAVEPIYYGCCLLDDW